MRRIFEECTYKNLTCKNRLVRSATSLGVANEDGSCSPEFFKIYEDLAKGEVGLIISEYCYVAEHLKSKSRMMGCYDERFIESYRPLVDRVHQYGSRFIVQLVECGNNSKYKIDEREVLGPSVFAHPKTGTVCREISVEEIQQLIHYFAQAASRVAFCGFDGVQLHAAHGYLFSQFLSPCFNQRSDKYGGSLENRARIILETIQAIKEVVPPNFHLSIKLHCDDFMENGFSFEECCQLCQWLENAGIDSIEVSGGNYSNRKDECYYAPYAKQLADLVNVPIFVVGGNRNLAKMEEILNQSKITGFSMCHALMCEPNLVMLWKENPNIQAKCRMCGQCFKTGKICVFHSD